MSKYFYTDSFVADSSHIKTAYYHKGEHNLFIQFIAGGLYGYSAVPEHIWDEFLTSASVGSFYNTHIRGGYRVIADVSGIEYIGWKDLDAPETHKFVIVGHSPVQYEFEGVSVDDAMEDFKRLFPQGTLKEVRVSFE